MFVLKHFLHILHSTFLTSKIGVTTCLVSRETFLNFRETFLICLM
uniref:Uncharacterized protein n=1 Tax=Anguilla anguilla TaxID=7936 RepID=A0A0E9R8K3_ANGAN